MRRATDPPRDERDAAIAIAGILIVVAVIYFAKPAQAKFPRSFPVTNAPVVRALGHFGGLEDAVHGVEALR